MSAKPERECELIRRFRAGDEDAFHTLVERHRPALERRAGRILPDVLRRRVSVGDVVQEALVVAFHRRVDFEGRGARVFGNWLIGIVENKAKRAVQHHVGTEKRRADREVSRGGRLDTEGFLSGRPSPSQVAMGHELEELARIAMGKLSPDHQEVLGLTRGERLSLSEIAEQMGRSRQAVKKLYGRALERFSANFKQLRGNDHA